MKGSKNGRMQIDPSSERATPRRYAVETWDDYQKVSERIVHRFDSEFTLRSFDFIHPTRLQRGTPQRFKKPYPARVAYTDWGDPANPTIVCCGGVAGTSMRFNYFASDLKKHFRIVAMDWVGRGLSGWMCYEHDYSFETYVQQLKQMIEHLNVGPVTILGSSLGGRAATEIAARYPWLVSRLIINDTGPCHPTKRHKRRAKVLSRFYVFRDPADLLRRVGASQKNDGPIGDDIRLYLTFHMTRWSDENGGRIYRHDMRAMQAYKSDVHFEQWKQWDKIHCPMLVIHGVLSDVLLPKTIKRMKKTQQISIMHVPDTGHTPALSDRNHTRFILDWLLHASPDPDECTVPYAPLREKWSPTRKKSLIEKTEIPSINKYNKNFAPK